jgi:hypothetical protein
MKNQFFKLIQLSENVYTVSAPLKIFSMQINTRTTIIRLKSGGLWVHSPVRLTPELKAQVLALNANITDIVAPSTFHHLFVNDWLEIAADAKLWIPEGLAEKRTDLKEYTLLSSASGWTDEIQCLKIDGMPKVNEYLFYHVASQGLICTDSLFYIPKPVGGLTKIYAFINHCKAFPSPTKLFLSMVKDKKAFKASIQQVIRWDFSYISMCHSEIFKADSTDDCKATFMSAYEFLDLNKTI